MTQTEMFPESKLPESPLLRTVRNMLNRHDCAVLIDQADAYGHRQVMSARSCLFAAALELGPRVRPLATEWDADWHWNRELSMRSLEQGSSK